MADQPGSMQVGYTAGELDPNLADNTALKYRGKGLKTALNIETIPTGGYRQRDGMRRIAGLGLTAGAGYDFTASDGLVYDLVLSNEGVFIYDATHVVASLATPYNLLQFRDLNYVQALDTALFFHVDFAPQRLRYNPAGATWIWDNAPLANIPTYNYGAVYTNGVAAVWNISFNGLINDTTLFYLTVSGEQSTTIQYSSTMATLATRVITALNSLAGLRPGYTVAPNGSTTLDITFSGTGNEGDGWAVSGTVTNKPDAAVISNKTTVGVEAGEPIISVARGWPRCGCFAQQRLLLGGFRSLPNTWMASITGEYYNFDIRDKTAKGAFVISMDVPGGEVIEQIAEQRSILIFTNRGEYWLSERTLDKTKVPNHVQASANGIARGTTIMPNENAGLFVFANRGIVGEIKYTDIDANFTTTGISILAGHIVKDIVSATVRRADLLSGDGALAVFARGDGTAVTAKLLREQDVTAFHRLVTDGQIYDAWRNGRNEVSMIVQRFADGVPSRALERLVPGLLLDGATTQTLSPAAAVVPNLAHHNAAYVWCIADGDIFGPFLPAGGTITLPKPASVVTVGRWPSVTAEHLPPPREVAQGVVLQRKGRIHTVWLSLEDTTSVAVRANAGLIYEVPLSLADAPASAGGDSANVPELQMGYSGRRKISGLRGYQVDPTVVVTQTRPGRLHLRSLIAEARL
jgi:hypothetical protein